MVKHLYIVSCDGPCGKVTEKPSREIPANWRRLNMGPWSPEKQAKTPGNLFSLLLCPDCQHKLTGWMEGNGYVTTVATAEEAKSDN